LSCERIFADKIDNLFRGTDHDLTFERQLPSDRRAQSGFADIFAYHKRANRANVNDTEPEQLPGDQGRLTSIRSTNVHRTKKNDPVHHGGKSEELEIRKQEWSEWSERYRR
jgi:hypothetical protein